jgi:hypothetical protein
MREVIMDRATEAKWEVEDAFFGALLGAVFGIIVPQKPWHLFLLLIMLLGGIVVYLKQAFCAVEKTERVLLVVNAFIITIFGSLFFCIIGYFEPSHSLWLTGTIMIWSLLKFSS